MTGALLLAALAAAAFAQSADKPPLAAGDTWTYKQVTDGKESSYTRRVVANFYGGLRRTSSGERFAERRQLLDRELETGRRLVTTEAA